MSRKVSLGWLVRVKASFLNEPANVVGFVYEEYRGGGVSIITQNGCDLGGFSEQEQEMYLEPIKDSGHTYQFANVIKLGIDWRQGKFKEIFKDYPPIPKPTA